MFKKAIILCLLLFVSACSLQTQEAPYDDVDKATGGKGWDCFGGPGLNAGNPQTAAAGGNWLSVWVPGAGDGHFPDGIGSSMGKGSLLIAEVHYNLNNGTGADSRQALVDGINYTLTYTIERTSETNTRLQPIL